VLLIGNCGTLSVMSLYPQKADIRLQRDIGRDWPFATKVQRSKNTYAPALVGVGYEWRIHDTRWQRDGKSDRLGRLCAPMRHCRERARPRVGSG
jgi:hypothetical protein